MRQARAALPLLCCVAASVMAPARAETLLQFALRQPYEPLHADTEWRANLDEAQRELERAGPTPADCAASLGAGRRAALLATLSSAQSHIGARDAALDAARQATRCAPRDAAVQARLATAALDALQPDLAAAAIDAGLRADASHETLRRLAIEHDYLRGRWQAVLRGYEILGHLRDGEPDASSGLLAFAARRYAQAAQDTGALEEPAPLAPADPDEWPAPLWRHLADGRPEQELVTAIEAETSPWLRARMLCEALFHLGEQARRRGNLATAQRHYAAALRSKALDESSHRLARARLLQLRQPAGAAGPAAAR